MTVPVSLFSVKIESPPPVSFGVVKALLLDAAPDVPISNAAIHEIADRLRLLREAWPQASAAPLLRTSELVATLKKAQSMIAAERAFIASCPKPGQFLHVQDEQLAIGAAALTGYLSLDAALAKPPSKWHYPARSLDLLHTRLRPGLPVDVGSEFAPRVQYCGTQRRPSDQGRRRSEARGARDAVRPRHTRILPSQFVASQSAATGCKCSILQLYLANSNMKAQQAAGRCCYVLRMAEGRTKQTAELLRRRPWQVGRSGRSSAPAHAHVALAIRCKSTRRGGPKMQHLTTLVSRI